MELTCNGTGGGQASTALVGRMCGFSPKRYTLVIFGEA